MSPLDIKNHQRVVLLNATYIDRLLAFGCNDQYCRMVTRPRGMVTNGGCKCHRVLADYALALATSADRIARRNNRELSVLDETPEQAELALSEQPEWHA